jgi:signal-transduction protein with cAMP-binding, CBS, and nucleotidyltransferase domain
MFNTTLPNNVYCDITAEIIFKLDENYELSCKIVFMRTVQNIINSKSKPKNIINSASLVIDALNMLNAVNLSYLIVMDGNEFKGIFSERDYTRNVILKGRASNTTKVKDVMSTDMPKVTLVDTVEECMNMINTHKTRYLLAYDEDQFVGVITIHDLLRQVISSREDVFNQNLTRSMIDYDEGSKIY